MIIIDEQTLLLGFLGMLIAATCMANILLALMIIDRAWRKHWAKKLYMQQRIESYAKREETWTYLPCRWVDKV